MKSIHAIIASTILAAFAATAQGAPSATAELHPDEIALGDAARLVVQVSGADSDLRVELPRVDSLDIESIGQSKQIRIVNGQMSSSVNFSFRIEATETGEFEIPAISVRSGGETASTEPLTLSVVKSSSASPPGMSNQPGAAAANPSNTTVAPEDLAFLRVERAENSGRDHLYVGEMTPIAVRAYFREGLQVTLNARPSLIDPAFTLREISEEPRQETTVVDGQRYRVLTWYAGLAGVKAGDFQIEATIDATVGIPQKQTGRNRRNSPFDSFGSGVFDDPFFDSFFDDFFARVEHREVTLTSEKFPVSLQALPSAGRPEHFDGAVGQFEIGSFSIPAELQTGDPETFKVTVNGKGNFDRVSMPHLQPEDGWKTYSAKDTVEAKDIITFEAKKTFEMPVIALQPGEREVSFSLAYFDPETGQYHTADSESIPVKITGTPIAASSVDTPAAQPDTAPAADAIAPLRSHPGGIVATFAPLYTRPWFIAGQAVASLVLLASLVIIGVRRHHARHPEFAQQRATAKAIDEQLHRAELALASQDAPKFFAAARRALQIKLGALWDCRPEAITSAEVSARRPAAGSAAPRIFAMADEVEFSGARPPADSFAEWNQRLEDTLAEFDNPAPAAAQSEPQHWGVVPNKGEPVSTLT